MEAGCPKVLAPLESLALICSSDLAEQWVGTFGWNIVGCAKINRTLSVGDLIGSDQGRSAVEVADDVFDIAVMPDPYDYITSGPRLVGVPPRSNRDHMIDTTRDPKGVALEGHTASEYKEPVPAPGHSTVATSGVK